MIDQLLGEFMARIRSFKRVSGASAEHPTEVDAEWSIVTREDGTALLQLSTFGSDHRVSKPKVSQTIQIDLKTARALCEAVDVAFPRTT